MFRLYEHEIDDGAPGNPLFRIGGPLVYQTTGRDSVLVADRERGSPTAIFRAQRSRIRPFPGGIFSIWRCSSCWSGVASSAFTERRSARTAGRCSSAAERPGQEHPHLRGRPRPLPGPGGGRGLDRFEQRPMVGHSFVIPSASRRQKLFPELRSHRALVQLNGERKIPVDLRRVRPGSVVTSGRPGPVVMMRRITGRACRLEKQRLMTLSANGCPVAQPRNRSNGLRPQGVLSSAMWRLSLALGR